MHNVYHSAHSRRQLQGKLISIIINNIIVVVISSGISNCICISATSAADAAAAAGGNIISKHNKQTNKRTNGRAEGRTDGQANRPAPRICLRIISKAFNNFNVYIFIYSYNIVRGIVAHPRRLSTECLGKLPVYDGVFLLICRGVCVKWPSLVKYVHFSLRIFAK